MSPESRGRDQYRMVHFRTLLDLLQLAVYDQNTLTYEVGMPFDVRSALLTFVRNELANTEASSEKKQPDLQRVVPWVEWNQT
jgi:hypothetical protein